MDKNLSRENRPWWREPDGEWRHGLLTIRNMSTGSVTIFDLVADELIDATPPAEMPDQWWKDRDA